MVESDTDRVWEIELSSGRAAIYAESVERFPDGLVLDRAGMERHSCEGYRTAEEIYARLFPSSEARLSA